MSTYEARMNEGLEPENIDKDFLRLWFVNNSDPYNDDVLPDAPKDLVVKLSWRYITLCERITGERFYLITPQRFQFLTPFRVSCT